jgi:hypothetical protein
MCYSKGRIWCQAGVRLDGSSDSAWFPAVEVCTDYTIDVPVAVEGWLKLPSAPTGDTAGGGMPVAPANQAGAGGLCLMSCELYAPDSLLLR